jgi:methionine-R-sulfoxide reductase
MRVKVFNRRGQLVGPVEVAKVVKTDAEWEKQLTPEQYHIARGKGTERPFCGNLLDNKRPGVYACVCCGLPLFASGGKFHSGTGWPSFFRPITEENVATGADHSHGMDRTEILCARCDAHLGHVFADGPPAHRPAVLRQFGVTYVHRRGRPGPPRRPRGRAVALTGKSAPFDGGEPWSGGDGPG